MNANEIKFSVGEWSFGENCCWGKYCINRMDRTVISFSDDVKSTEYGLDYMKIIFKDEERKPRLIFGLTHMTKIEISEFLKN